MTLTETLGSFVANVRAREFTDVLREQLALHVFDTVGAAIAGSALAETRDVAAIVTDAYGAGPALSLGTDVPTSMPAAALLGAVSARCSELDDIHLRSCVTPGAVVVPVAFAVAQCAGEIDGATFLAACAAGVELLVRFGIGVNGPGILYRNLWPTYLCAGLGAAATTARLLTLDGQQAAHALGIAAALAVGTTGRPAGKTSRWLTLGAAVQNGVLAALAAQRGMNGDVAFFDGKWSDITGIALDRDAVLHDLGDRYECEAVSLKPWCAAKQTIAATQALRELLVDERFDVRMLRAIEVGVPGAYRAMIDRPALPASRLEALTSVRYQLALAAFAPERMDAIAHALIDDDVAVARLLSRTTVVADGALDAAYPAAWPARVTVTTDAGDCFTRTVLHAAGDPGTAFSWAGVQAKIERATGMPATGVHAVATACRELAHAPDLTAFRDAVARRRAPHDPEK